jgi:hypothetical protein
MKLPKVVVITLLTALLFSCFRTNKYQLASANEGNLNFVDSQSGKVYYVNKSGNIVDVVDLNIPAASVQAIKAAKEKQDAAQKSRDMGELSLSGTKFTLTLRTRYYKDKLLYILEMKPFDETAAYKVSTIRVNLVDATGFTLETIEPQAWSSSVDDKGNRVSEMSTGSIPMTLDNFLEVSSWYPMWRF